MSHSIRSLVVHYVEQDSLSCSGRSRQRDEHKLGLVLVAISAVYIICQSVKMVPGRDMRRNYYTKKPWLIIVALLSVY